MDPTEALKTQSREGEPVWYFAYGSNMQRASMTARQVAPLDARPARLLDYYVSFDVFGIPFSEPSYASVEKFPAEGEEERSVQLQWGTRRMRVPSACGIAYLVTAEDLHRLVVTEGSGVVYNVIKARARFLDRVGGGEEEEEEVEADEETTMVHTLKAKHPQRPNGAPSVRYMNLFRDGAAAMALPIEYQRYLETFPTYEKPAAGMEPWGSGIFTYFWRPMIKQIVRLHRYKVNSDGECPMWVAKLICTAYQVMWRYHDRIHQHVFSSGDGGKLHFRTSKLYNAVDREEDGY